MTVLRRESIPLDRKHPKPDPLIEAKRSSIGGRSRDGERHRPFRPAHADRVLDQAAPYAVTLVR